MIPGLLALLLQAPAPAVLRVGLDPREAPAAFIPGGNYSYDEMRRAPLMGEEALTRVEGFDVDVMNALAQRLGVKARVVPTSWFDLEAGLVAGRYDAIIGSWTPSDKTPKEIAASIPYYDWGLLVAVREQDASIRAFREINGRRIGHIPDPSIERALAELEKGLGARSVLLRDSGALLFEDLRAGTIDALLFDSPFVRWKVAQEPRSFRIVGEPLNRLGYHVGLRSTDTSLLARVNDAIHDFRESGEMARVQRRWEGGP